MFNFCFQTSLVVGAHWQGIDLGITMEGFFHNLFISLVADIACVIVPACTLLFSSGVRQEIAQIFVIL